MRPVWVLALNTYKEVIRDRILYALILFAVLLIGLSLALGQLSFAEQARISANFGLTGIHLVVVALAIFVGSNLVYKEIEKKTIMTIWFGPSAEPNLFSQSTWPDDGHRHDDGWSRADFSAGFLGLDKPVDFRFALVLCGLLAEAMVLLGITIFFS